MSLGGVVVEGLGEANGQFAFPALRTQAQIDAKDRTFGGQAGQNFRDLLRQANEIFAVRHGRSRGRFSVSIDEHEVDVRAVIELVASQLSEGQDGEGGVHQTSGGVEVLRRIETAQQAGVCVPQGMFDQDIGQRGNLGRGFGQGSDFQHIPQHDTEVFAALETSQENGDVGFERTGAEAGERFMELLTGEASVQISVAQEGLQNIGIPQQGLPQEATVSEHHDGVVGERMVLIEQVLCLRGFTGETVKKNERGVGVGRLGQQRRQGCGQSGGKSAADLGQQGPSALRILERDARFRAGWAARFSLIRAKRRTGLAWRSRGRQGTGLENSA